MIQNFARYEGFLEPPRTARINLSLPFFTGSYGDLPTPPAWLVQSDTHLDGTALAIARTALEPQCTAHALTNSYRMVVLNEVSDKLQDPNDTHRHPPLSYPEALELSDAVLAFPTEEDPHITPAIVRRLGYALRFLGNPSALNSRLARSIRLASHALPNSPRTGSTSWSHSRRPGETVTQQFAYDRTCNYFTLLIERTFEIDHGT